MEQEKGNLPPGFLIKYGHVRGGIYRARKKASQKAKDVVKGVEEWIKQIEKVKGKGIFLETIDDDPQQFMIAWCSAFQLQVMLCNILNQSLNHTLKTSKSLLSTWSSCNG
jgi:hypothetical protein